MLSKDFLFAARTLRKNPLFALTAIVTIALGVGASTAIFSVTNAVLLRPLPYRDPGRLVLANVDLRRRDVKDLPFSNANFFDLRSGATHSFEDFGTVNTGRQVFPREDGTPEQVRVAGVTTNFFRLLGMQVALGRDFQDADGQPVAAGTPAQARPQAIAILSHEYWQRRYGGNPAVLGHALRTGGNAGPQIVGVLAPGAELLFPPKFNMERVPDVWFAARLRYDADQRNNFGLRVVGRLKPGVTVASAQTEVDAISEQLRKNFVVQQTAGFQIRLEPMHAYLVAQARPAILALMGAVIFLLLIACANVANLVLVRASVREREVAVRAALGGSRWRLLRQMLAESLLLAGIGTLSGLFVAKLALDTLMTVAPIDLPRLDSIRIDPVVLGFTALAGLASAALFGMLPAWRASRPDMIHILRASGRTGGLGSGRFIRHSVVIAEVALSFVLLIGSGLMFRSFLALQRIDPGFDSHNVLTFLLLGGRGGAQPEQRAAAMREIESRLRAIPGVQSVTAGSPFPLADRFSPIRWGTEQALGDPSKFQAVDNQFVLPGYFETMRIPLLAGRTFTQADNVPNRNLAIVDSFLATKAFPNQSAVGKRILLRTRTPEPEWMEIIGVVAHQRANSLAEPGREQVFLTDGFIGHGAAARWALRTAGDPGRYAAAARAEIAKFDAGRLITEMQPMEVVVDKAQGETRFSLLLIGAFAVVAVLLAAGGLYGVLSTVVRQRTAEIGVRVALGAAPASILQLVVGQGLRLSTAGIAAGLIAALALTRLMTGMLVGVKPTDPATFAGMAAIFLVIAAIASWLPARRAANLDPTVALREE